MLNGKTALVTGGGRGIGRAIVDLFCAHGAKVWACGRGERPEDLADAIHWRRCDVADPTSVQALYEATGPVDILVANAGIQIEKTAPESADQDWDAVLDINCRGVFHAARAYVPAMEAKGGGVVLAMGSTSAGVAEPGMALYNASKAFVEAFIRGLAVDHGPKVRANAIRPGWIMTPMSADAFATASDPAAAEKDAISRHPMRRLGRPEDIAQAALWLASDQASWVTGQCFTIDGGLTAGSQIRPDLIA